MSFASKASNLILQSSLVHHISNIFCVNILTENCIFMSNFDSIVATIPFQWNSIFVFVLFRRSNICVSSQHDDTL